MPIADDELRAVARAISDAEIVLPPGLNTAAALDWPAQAASGPLTEDDVRLLLETNAARDWAWYAAHHRLTGEQRRIVEQIPRWPALRGGGYAREIAARLADPSYGPDSDAARAFAASLYRERGGAPPPDPSW